MISREARTAVFIVALFLCYIANRRTIPFLYGGDTIPARLIPFSVLGFGRLTLDPFRYNMEAAGGYRWYIKERDGHLISFYPIGAALVALPVYVPAYVALAATGPVTRARLFAFAPVVEKIAASFIAALCCALVFLLALGRAPPRVAAGAAITLGLASSMWATASQGLWPHGPVALMILAAFWLLEAPYRTSWSVAGAGFALAMAVITRPTAALFAVAACAAILSGTGSLAARLRRASPFVLGALPVVAFNAGYNWTFYQNPVGPYGGLIGRLALAGMGEGVAGLLVSPNRGLLVFTPIAVLGLVGIGRAILQRGRDPLLALFSMASLAHTAIVGSYVEWAGGWSFGPRYLVDVLPILAIAGAEMWPLMRPAWRRLAWTAIAWSLLVQLNGAFVYPASGWNARMSAIGLERAAWDWRHFSLWEDQAAWWRLGKDAPRF